jgi:hypothetical protein
MNSSRKQQSREIHTRHIIRPKEKCLFLMTTDFEIESVGRDFFFKFFLEITKKKCIFNTEVEG